MNWYKQSQHWGKAGAGILFTCPEDHTGLLLLRSEQVEEPGTLGISGGAIGSDGYYSDEEIEPEFDANSAWEAAQRETIEELGHFPNEYKILGQTKYQDGNFEYTTFIVAVSLAEKEKMTGSFSLNWENDDADWVPLSQFENLPNLHHGVDFTYNNFNWKQIKGQ